MATKLRVQLQEEVSEEQYPIVTKEKTSQRVRLVILSLLQRIRSDSLLRNSIFIMGSTLVTSVVGYLYWVLAAHMYSAYDIGLASAFISAMSLTSTFANLGIGSALIQLLPRRAAGYEWSITLNACMIAGIFTSIVGGIIVAIALPLLSPQFATGKYHLLYLICFVVGVVLCTVTTLLDQTFVAERATGNMATRNAVFALLKLPLMMLLVQVGALGVFSSWVLSLIATLILAVLVLIPRLKRSYRLTTRNMTKQMRSMLTVFAGHHFINIGGMLPMYLLPVFVAMELSVTDNAYFYTTWMMGSLFFTISPAVATSLFSEGVHEASGVMHKVRNSSILITALLVPILLVFLLSGSFVLSLFGPSYAQRGLPLLLILMSSTIPDAITNIYVSLLRVQRRLRRAAMLNLGMATLTLAIAWILLPKLGIVGAGWAWLIAQSTGSLVVGIDAITSRNYIANVAKASTPVSPLQKLTLRNVSGFLRYIAIRLRFRNLHVGLFFLDRGGQIDISPNARIQFGRNICFIRDFTGYFAGNIKIGDEVFFNRNCYIAVYDGLTIGNYCLFGEGVSIHDENHVVGTGPEPIASRGFVARPIVIGDNVWVGAKATILSGVNIGNNAVIGANAVVTHDVPANTIVGGIPARVLREIQPSIIPSEQSHDTTNVEQNHEDAAAIWLVDTIKQLAVQLPLKGQYYGEIESTNNRYKLHLPSRPVREKTNTPVEGFK